MSNYYSSKFHWGRHCANIDCDYIHPYDYGFWGQCKTCKVWYCSRQCKDEDNAEGHADFCASTYDERIIKFLKNAKMGNSNCRIPNYKFSLKHKAYIRMCIICGETRSNIDTQVCKNCKGTYRCGVTFKKVCFMNDECNKQNRRNLLILLWHVKVKLPKDLGIYLLHNFIWCSHPHHNLDALE